MNANRTTPPFKQIHVIFLLVLIILVACFTWRIMFLYGFDPVLLQLSSLFFICLSATGATWVWLWNRQTATYIQALDAAIERAIHDQPPLTIYEETALSSMEHKLKRYIGIAKANERNIQTEKNKIKELISDISHQTKTPLSNIMVFSQLLEETHGLSEDARHYVQHIQAQSDKLDWLIQSLIKLSRLETGMISLQIEAKPLIQTLTKALSQVYILAENKQITISIDCGTDITACHDAKWTSEALFNLLENAVKYTPQGGQISIYAECNEMFTCIELTDTGPGIPGEEFPHIFKRFYRGKQVREVEGVGIGLFLAREIISAQGGHIKVSSEVGTGTTFKVFLPQR
ncbi:two-component sensor histidine kinase [Paenibacillus albidus]|uniref:histidine kinase n=1 Tax=Paenibacillus albidus TaxID=2041023 RepID=A0A917F922_9BACL|nr:HAMP domain-containing sensor histidine kinase [Paenibacillus albidus]GGF61375.1 two-component sensor histidine kinase [Paenibacillus albidus]